MARDAKGDDYNGDLQIMLECPECDFYGEVLYKTHPPKYCSDACKQKAYRKRRIRNSQPVTKLKHEFEEMGLSKAQVRQLESIVDTWGPEAARAAAKLALSVAAEVREKYMRY